MAAITCSHEDCEGRALWLPVLEVRPRPRALGRRVLLEELAYCEQHKATVTLADLLSEEGFAKLAKHVREAGRGKIDRDATTLAWSKIRNAQRLRLSHSQKRTRTITPDDEADLAF